MRNKSVPILILIVLLLSSCKLDTWLGYETVEPSALYTITVAPTPDTTATPTRDPNVTPSPVPTLGTGSTRVSPVDGMTMAYIPEGEFRMGSDTAPDESPVHTVYLDAFWMDQTEVTCGQFKKFISETDYRRSATFIGYSEQQCSRGDNHPVRAVWDAAKAYCEWAGRRLPTEAEWERAARGGLEGEKYPWGDTDPVCERGVGSGAMFYDGTNCTSSGTVPVKSYYPNGFFLFDMAGNVSEWVADWYSEDYYKTRSGETTAHENPQGPDSGIHRVHRGGSYRSDASALRVANREGMPPANMFGFRCAMDAKR